MPRTCHRSLTLGPESSWPNTQEDLSALIMFEHTFTGWYRCLHVRVNARVLTSLRWPLHAPSDRGRVNKDDNSICKHVCLAFHLELETTPSPFPLVSKLSAKESKKVSCKALCSPYFPPAGGVAMVHFPHSEPALAQSVHTKLPLGVWGWVAWVANSLPMPLGSRQAKSTKGIMSG